MSVLLKKILWYPTSSLVVAPNGSFTYSDKENITNLISFTGRKNIDIKNNSLQFTVKNYHEPIGQTTSIRGHYVSDLGLIKFNERDQIKVYLKLTDDGADITNGLWGNNTEEPGDDWLAGTFFVTEYTITHDTNKSWIAVTCFDKNYIVFNKLIPYAFSSSGWTAPEMIQKIIKIATQAPDGLFQGTSSDLAVLYHIDARLVSEGGHITDTRDTSPTSNFPDRTLSKLFKPAYEWISDLSQVQYLNTDAELNSTLHYKRPFIFWLDESNVFYWEYPNNTAETTLATDGGHYINTVRMTKQVFNTVNMIIFNAGKDLYGNDVQQYEFNQTSNIKGLKMQFVPMTDIATTLFSKEKVAGNLVENAAGVFTFDGKKYNASGYNLTTEWGEVVTGNDDYNNAFNDRCEFEARNKAKSMLAGLAHARWKGSVTMRGSLSYNPGNGLSYRYSAGKLLTFTDATAGINKNLRIIATTHQVDKSNWTTTLDLEEDAQEWTGGVT